MLENGVLPLSFFARGSGFRKMNGIHFCACEILFFRAEGIYNNTVAHKSVELYSVTL